MGNSESAPPENTLDDFDGVETLGYRVLGVQPNSPASTAGLVSFFDFLIGADGEMLLGSGEDLQEGEEYDDVDFPALLGKFKGKPLELLVWNIKCQQQRLVDIVPSDNWDGAGLLGVTIRLDNYAGAEDRLIRILNVEHNSPAAIAGLVSSQDYLLGTTTHSFDSTKVLAAVLEAHVDKVVELYVYNTNSDKVRVVALMPTWSWGGNGLLGAEVGTGYLHRLPGSCRETLGGSVERRVRWIGGASKNGPTPQSSESLQNAPTLELEPQLEMEHDDEAEEEEDPRERAESSVGTVSLTSQVSAAVEAGGSQEEKYKPDEAAPVQPPEVATITTATTAARPTDEQFLTENIVSTTKTNEATPIKEDADSAGSGVFIPAPRALQNLPPTEFSPPADVLAPAPFPIGTPEQSVLPTDPAAQPITVTTFIPGPKPPPISETISAEDLFSGPPPVAKIPTQTSVVINSPLDSPDKKQFARTPECVNSDGSFATPHPPSVVREAAVAGGTDEIMPPPPKMSGVQRDRVGS